MCWGLISLDTVMRKILVKYFLEVFKSFFLKSFSRKKLDDKNVLILVFILVTQMASCHYTVSQKNTCSPPEFSQIDSVKLESPYLFDPFSR